MSAELLDRNIAVRGLARGRWRFDMGVTVILLASYSYLLRFVYQSLSPRYEYLGFTYAEPDEYSFFVMTIVCSFLAFAMPDTLVDAADYLLWWLFMAAVTPSIVLSQVSGWLSASDAIRLSIGLSAVWFLAVVAMRRSTLTFSFRVGRPSTRTFWTVVLVQTAVSYGLLAVTGALTLSIPGIYDVYSVRTNFNQAVSGRAWMGYLLPLQFYVLNPLLMALGVRGRRYGLVAGAALGQIVMYSTMGHKTILLSIPLVIAVSLFFRRRRGVQALPVALAFVSLPLVAALVDMVVFSASTLTDVITRRFLIVPGLLSSVYWSVFQGQPKTLFFELWPGGTSPYEVNAANLVMGEMTGSESGSANVSFIGHGYVSGGFLGIVIELAVLVGFVVVLRALTSEVPLALAIGAVALPTMAFAESSIFVAIVTHGGLGALLWLRMLPERFLIDDSGTDRRVASEGGPKLELTASRPPGLPIGQRVEPGA